MAAHMRYRFAIDSRGIIRAVSIETARLFDVMPGDRFGYSPVVEGWRNIAGRRYFEQAMDTGRIITTHEGDDPFLFIPASHGALLVGDAPDWLVRLVSARHYRQLLQGMMRGQGIPPRLLHLALRHSIEQAAPWRHHPAGPERR